MARQITFSCWVNVADNQYGNLFYLGNAFDNGFGAEVSAYSPELFALKLLVPLAGTPATVYLPWERWVFLTVLISYTDGDTAVALAVYVHGEESIRTAVSASSTQFTPAPLNSPLFLGMQGTANANGGGFSFQMASVQVRSSALRDLCV